VDQPILGGQLSFKSNLTSLSRQAADFDPISQTAYRNGQCANMSANPNLKNPNDCVLRGTPGNYTRFSVEANWKRTITDQFGQVFTPFASLRADAAAMEIRDRVGVYPFINIQSWGTQTIEPIAQVIARPNEQLARRLPNEDAQSLVFDDSNLFRVDKFSGWDRMEGGGRANYGLQYTMQFNQGGFINALFGQSYQLFGTNSFAVGDATNTGLESGLDTRRSDYVARLTYQPDSIYSLSTRYRFDKDSFALQRFEVEGRANFDRWSISALYGNYAAQPLLGFLQRREGILGSINVKLTPNWVLQTAARYDLDSHDFSQTRIGVGYVDDCLILGLNYITNYAYNINASNNPDPKLDHRFMLQLSLRTLGDTAVSTSTNSLGL
jgi:LPS-assembly protein